jgi:hypothetical protein
MQNGWGMREKFKSIRVILQKVISVVKFQNMYEITIGCMCKSNFT